MTDSYEPIAIVDVAKLFKNLLAVKLLAKNSKVYAVVKSDAYGHGIELAKFIDSQVDGFAVQNVDEGMKLRFLGVSKPIMLLLPLTSSQLAIASRYDLSVPCYSTENAETLAQFSKKMRITVNFKIDTGMNRLGFVENGQFLSSLKLLSNCPNVVINSLYSHFANAEIVFDCEKQMEKFLFFQKIFDDYSDGFKHISASGGLIHQKFNLDAVRVGIMLYGYKPFNCDVELFPILKIVAPTLKDCKFCGTEKCLYNATTKSGEFSLVEYGYSDGLFRNSEINRCMNLSYVKKTGDNFAVVMSDAEKIAKENKTISYEALVKCARHLKKIYTGLL